MLPDSCQEQVSKLYTSKSNLKMVTELDIYRTAKVLIDNYGDSALIEAGLRQDEFLSKGDLEGARLWSKISDAIEWFKTPANLAQETIQ